MSAWWLRMARFARPHWRGLTGVLGLMVAGAALELLKPWPIKLLVDHVLPGTPLPREVASMGRLPGGSSPSGLIAWLAVATVVLFVGGRLAVAAQSYVQAGVGSRMTYTLAGEVFARLQRLTPRYHLRHPTGDLVRRVTTDSGCLQNLVVKVAVPIVSALLSVVAIVVILWRLDRTLALLALAVVPVMTLLIRMFDRPMTESSSAQQEMEGKMMALAEQTLTALPVVQAFTREEHHDESFRALSRRTFGAYLRVMQAQLQFKVAVGSVTALGTSLIMVVGGLHVLSGEATIGTLLVFLSYLTSLYTPVSTLAYATTGLAAASASGHRILEVLDAEEEVREKAGAAALARARGEVRLEGVSFGYDAERPVLQEVTLHARPGETLALVGASGAGKSTLVSLIPRFFDPWQGRVLIDGVDVRDVGLKSLREQVALVLQEPFLLPLSVAENVAYGRVGASREQIERAARAANAHEFIERLPQGYETVLGERGATLSGGQRQRLSIARALVRDAPILILDEPTSALDLETEALLLEALERLMEGRTTFLIAHRLSTIRNADRIVVLQHGRVVEQGTHHELLAAQGPYRAARERHQGVMPAASQA